MVISIIPHPGMLETLLNNLVEAGYSLGDVSVLLRTPDTRNPAVERGPFVGVTPNRLPGRLMMLGLSRDEALWYAGAVKEGKLFVAIKTTRGQDELAVSMLEDYGPEDVRSI